MLSFVLYILGYFILFRACDVGRVESEKYSLFTDNGFIQFIMILLGTCIISLGDKLLN